MVYPHTRQLGAQPGVQLNPLRDNTDGFATGDSDQMAALAGRFKRGRIDSAFRVNRGNLRSMLGAPESIRVSALNEAYVQLYEALNNGVTEAVVARLVTDAAVNSYAVFNVAAGGASSFVASAAVPVAPYVFYLQHLECFNDGITIKVSAEKALDTDGVTAIPAKVITLSIVEPNGNLLYEFTGSLDPAAKDDYGQDYFIGSVISAQTDAVTISVAANAAIPVNADCYGRNADGTAKVATTGSSPLVLFTEGGTAYSDAHYDNAINRLEKGPYDFGYIMSGGTAAVSLLSKLVQLAVRSNRPMAFDVPGSLSAAAAQAFVNQLNIDTHYVAAYWAPLQSDDPVNGGKAIIGTSGYNIGLRCARNAQTNAYGLAPKNAPVAGKNWPLSRTGVKQLTTPGDTELNDLAKARINPVIFETYEDGGRYVFSDSLTCAKVSTSYKKLISVAEMSASVDDTVAKFAKGTKQLPMDVAITRTERFLKSYFDGCRASGWLVPSSDASLGDKGYTFTVTRNAQRPADRFDITYGTHYDGVARAIYITQTLSR